MVPAPFIVVVDANVLFPFTLRDTVLRAAASGLYQLHWTSEILDEMERNLVSTGTMPAAKAARLRKAMEKAFPEAEVSGYESLVAAMKNDVKDRHVAAAAVKAGDRSAHAGSKRRAHRRARLGPSDPRAVDVSG